jgi:hypothetical protein
VRDVGNVEWVRGSLRCTGSPGPTAQKEEDLAEGGARGSNIEFSRSQSRQNFSVRTNRQRTFDCRLQVYL